MSLEGVELENTQKQLISKWGEADSRNRNGNSEFLIYKKYGAVVTLEKDIVTEIKMTDSTTFALSNKLKLGAKQEEVEKLLGKKAKRKGNNYLYSGKSKLALRYISSKLVEILVYK